MAAGLAETGDEWTSLQLGVWEVTGMFFPCRSASGDPPQVCTVPGDNSN